MEKMMGRKAATDNLTILKEDLKRENEEFSRLMGTRRFDEPGMVMRLKSHNGDKHASA
jgi:hypothetical protein